MNEVVRSSNGRYTVNERKDASDFLRWLVNTLRAGLRDKDHSRKKKERWQMIDES